MAMYRELREGIDVLHKFCNALVLRVTLDLCVTSYVLLVKRPNVTRCNAAYVFGTKKE